MKRNFAAALFVVALTAAPAFAHRLDEYLQATTVVLEKDRVAIQFTLTPGVQVSAKVIAGMDTDGDGILSDAEQAAYIARVEREISLTLDGAPLKLRLLSSTFPKIENMKDGLGSILLNFEATVTSGGAKRHLLLENHHETAIASYLVNCLVPSDPDIRVVAQHRNYEQSFYQLEYTQPHASPALTTSPTFTAWLVADALAVLALLASMRRVRGRTAVKARAA